MLGCFDIILACAKWTDTVGQTRGNIPHHAYALYTGMFLSDKKHAVSKYGRISGGIASQFI